MDNLKQNVLYELKKSKDRFVSGEKLARAIGCTRTAIWKKIQSLRGEGYIVDSFPRLGYRLVRVPDLILPLEVKHSLTTKFLGREIYYFSRVGSTIDVAKDLATGGCPQGVIVIAEEQSKGRGRLKRKWVSPKGGIWFSLILRPSFLPQDAPLLTLAAACSLVQTIQQHLGLDAKIKWPNDVLVSGRKVAGILTEMDAEPDRIIFIILSIGINANVDVCKFPPALRGKSTSLKDAVGKKINRVSFFQVLLENLENGYQWVEKGKREIILERWRKLSTVLGKKVKVSVAGRKIEGRAIGLSPQGALLVKLSSGKIVKVSAGDVVLAR